MPDFGFIVDDGVLRTEYTQGGIKAGGHFDEVLKVRTLLMVQGAEGCGPCVQITVQQGCVRVPQFAGRRCGVAAGKGKADHGPGRAADLGVWHVHAPPCVRTLRTLCTGPPGSGTVR